MTSTSLNRQQYLLAKLKYYVQAAHKHFFDTPERSLEQAYQAALRIKSIEDEYFNGNKVITESADHGTYLASFSADRL